eukprot:3946163-Pleurochrysis_carterae.AAC.2
MSLTERRAKGECEGLKGCIRAAFEDSSRLAVKPGRTNRAQAMIEDVALVGKESHNREHVQRMNLPFSLLLPLRLIRPGLLRGAGLQRNVSQACSKD